MGEGHERQAVARLQGAACERRSSIPVAPGTWDPSGIGHPKRHAKASAMRAHPSDDPLDAGQDAPPPTTAPATTAEARALGRRASRHIRTDFSARAVGLLYTARLEELAKA